MESIKNKADILAYLPTPPPYAGPEVASKMLLKACKKRSINMIHINSKIRKENWQKGKFDIEGIIKFVKIYFLFVSCLLTKSPGKVYFLLSSSIAGFLRDSVIILTAKLFRKKTCAHYRGGNFHNFYNQQSAFVRWFIEFVLAKTDCIIVQAERLKFMFENIYTPDKIRVLYNGLNIRDYKTIKYKYNPNSSRNCFTIFFMGHVSFSKGFYEAVKAIKEIATTHHIKFLYAGTKRYTSDKNKTAKGFLSGSSRIFFEKHAEEIETTITDFVVNGEKYNSEYLGIIKEEEKQAAFSQADLLILPSYTEGFSMSVLEAMAFGLPVIVTDVGAFPEIVKDEVNGLITKPGDENMLKEKILSFVVDPEKAKQIGKTNKQYVAKNFSIETIAQKLEQILLSV